MQVYYLYTYTLMIRIFILMIKLWFAMQYVKCKLVTSLFVINIAKACALYNGGGCSGIATVNDDLTSVSLIRVIWVN